MTTGGSSFIDISVTGTSVGAISDDSEHSITLPSFTFNGVAYTTAVVGNNGAVLFPTSASSINYTNGALPAAIGAELTGALGSTANIGICPWWDDFTPGAGGSVRTQTVGGFFIVQWTAEDHFCCTGHRNGHVPGPVAIGNG
ncbi:MAG: hypothetical protein IPP33_00575 [Flavobacteriales bacterium]|nr:hypothetical protein [Flavobacteriales bacterium]